MNLLFLNLTRNLYDKPLELTVLFNFEKTYSNIFTKIDILCALQNLLLNPGHIGTLTVKNIA